MKLEIQPVTRFGLQYFAVVTFIGDHPSTLTTFMSEAGARDYVRRVIKTVNDYPSLFVA